MPYISATAEIMYAPLDLRFVIVQLQTAEYAEDAKTSFIFPTRCGLRSRPQVGSFGAMQPNLAYGLGVSAVRPLLHLLPQFGPWIVRVQLCQLAQQLFCLLVARGGDDDLNFHDLVAAYAITRRRGYALFAQAQLLSGLRAGRNLEQRAAVDGRHFNLRAEAGFRSAHRHGDANVVALAAENGMLAGAHNDVEVAGRAAVTSCIALAGEPDALPVARARLDSDFQRFGAVHHAFAAAHRTNGPVLTRAAAARARHVELHASALLRDLAGAVALRTRPRLFEKSDAVAVRTCVLARDAEAQHGAADRLPEVHSDLVFEVAARLRAFGLHAATIEDAGEDVAEPARPAARSARASASASTLEQVGEVETAEVEAAALSAASARASGVAAAKPARTGAAGLSATARVRFGRCRINVVAVEAELIVNPALLGIAEDVVRFRDLLELFFRGLVAGIDVGVILARQLAKRLADVLRAGGLFDAERAVIVFLGGGGHCWLRQQLHVLQIPTVESSSGRVLCGRRTRRVLHGDAAQSFQRCCSGKLAMM